MAYHDPGSLSCVHIDNLTVRRGRLTLLDGVSFRVRCGQISAIIGPNGAGKTTLLRAILGDIPYSGSIVYTDHLDRPLKKIRTGYVPQHLLFDKSTPLCVMDALCAAKSKRPVWAGCGAGMKQAVEAMLESTGCAHLARRRLGELSGGEMQRVMLALALDESPDLLMMDEPVSGVDVHGLGQFYRTVSELRRMQHMAVVLVSHDLELVARYADYAVLLGGRLLADGAPRQVYATDAFAEVFGGAGEYRFGEE